MKTLEARITTLVMETCVYAALFTPVLALIKLFTPLPLPWLGVFLPLVAGLHILLTWVTAQILVRMLWNLLHPSR